MADVMSKVGSTDPHFDGRKAEPFDFRRDIRVPTGIRLFGLAGTPFVVPGKGGASRVYVHPDDLLALQAANPEYEDNHVIS